MGVKHKCISIISRAFLWEISSYFKWCFSRINLPCKSRSCKFMQVLPNRCVRKKRFCIPISYVCLDILSIFNHPFNVLTIEDKFFTLLVLLHMGTTRICIRIFRGKRPTGQPRSRRENNTECPYERYPK
jgi:hypothetical protein